VAGQLLNSAETQRCRACLALQGLSDGTRSLLCESGQVAQLPVCLLYPVRVSAATHNLAEYSTTSEAKRAACRSEGTVPYMYVDSLYVSRECQSCCQYQSRHVLTKLHHADLAGVGLSITLPILHKIAVHKTSAIIYLHVWPTTAPLLTPASISLQSATVLSSAFHICLLSQRLHLPLQLRIHRRQPAARDPLLAGAVYNARAH
jgi:hypothetical protein